MDVAILNPTLRKFTKVFSSGDLSLRTHSQVMESKTNYLPPRDPARPGLLPENLSADWKKRAEAHLAAFDKVVGKIDIAIKQARDVLRKPVPVGLSQLDASGRSSEEQQEERMSHIDFYIRMRKHLHNLEMVVLQLKKRSRNPAAHSENVDELVDAVNEEFRKDVEDAESLLTQRPREFVSLIKHRQQKIYVDIEECERTIKRVLNLDVTEGSEGLRERESVPSPASVSSEAILYQSDLEDVRHEVPDVCLDSLNYDLLEHSPEINSQGIKVGGDISEIWPEGLKGGFKKFHEGYSKDLNEISSLDSRPNDSRLGMEERDSSCEGSLNVAFMELAEVLSSSCESSFNNAFMDISKMSEASLQPKTPPVEINDSDSLAKLNTSLKETFEDLHKEKPPSMFDKISLTPPSPVEPLLDQVFIV